MSSRWLFVAVGLLAMLAGSASWLAHRGLPQVAPARVAPEALFATSLHDTAGHPQKIGDYAGKVLVLNFWATWCAPCRAEMPAFSRVQARLGTQAQILGLTSDDPERVARFADEVPVAYPLLVGGPEVDALAVALGNHDRVLPFTVVLDPHGRVVEQHVGAYSESALGEVIARAGRPEGAKQPHFP
jgi:thiol-disulfide isomerase/thioredoxin